jgi:hypothetical protein
MGKTGFAAAGTSGIAGNSFEKLSHGVSFRAVAIAKAGICADLDGRLG